MDTDVSSPLYSTLTIQEIVEEVPGFKTFVFADGHKIIYQPGQFLTLVHLSGHEAVRRSYSITSAPVLGERLSIGVKRITNGLFSRKLVDGARVGDTVLTTGAGGLFCLPKNIEAYDTIFFFAAGSGISPIYSLLKTVLYHYPQVRVYLIYSNHSPGTTIFYNALKTLETQFAERFFTDFLFSNAFDLKRARLNRDLLLQLLASYKHDPLKTLYYTCGPEAYMRMVIYLLQEIRVPKDHIRKEDFIPQRTVFQKPMPPDLNAHAVTLQTLKARYELNVKYPDTILAAAKKAMIALPYSCETGKCGNCVARCLQGQVWLSHNEVLTEKDLAQGLTLTCVGYPVYGDVVLQLNQF